MENEDKNKAYGQLIHDLHNAYYEHGGTVIVMCSDADGESICMVHGKHSRLVRTVSSACYQEKLVKMILQKALAEEKTLVDNHGR